MNSKEIIKDIKKALNQFGEYTYYDKGAFEVMDVNKYEKEASKMDPKELGKVLLEVLKYEHGNQFVISLIGSLDNMPDDWWNELMKFPELEKLY